MYNQPPPKTFQDLLNRSGEMIEYPRMEWQDSLAWFVSDWLNLNHYPTHQVVIVPGRVM